MIAPELRSRAGNGRRHRSPPHQRTRIRQRHRDLHPRRGCRARVRTRHRGRHGGHRRADAGADGVPLLRQSDFYTRLETITARWPIGILIDGRRLAPGRISRLERGWPHIRSGSRLDRGAHTRNVFVRFGLGGVLARPLRFSSRLRRWHVHRHATGAVTLLGGGRELPPRRRAPGV